MRICSPIAWTRIKVTQRYQRSHQRTSSRLVSGSILPSLHQLTTVAILTDVAPLQIGNAHVTPPYDLVDSRHEVQHEQPDDQGHHGDITRSPIAREWYEAEARRQERENRKFSTHRGKGGGGAVDNTLPTPTPLYEQGTKKPNGTLERSARHSTKKYKLSCHRAEWCL
jgi:hypothetical protein